MFLLSKCPPTELVLSAVLVQQFGNVSRNIPDTHHYLFDVSDILVCSLLIPATL